MFFSNLQHAKIFWPIRLNHSGPSGTAKKSKFLLYNFSQYNFEKLLGTLIYSTCHSPQVFFQLSERYPRLPVYIKRLQIRLFKLKISLLKIKKYSTFHALVSLTENIRKRLRILGKVDLDNRNIGDECCCDCGWAWLLFLAFSNLIIVLEDSNTGVFSLSNAVGYYRNLYLKVLAKRLPHQQLKMQWNHIVHRTVFRQV